MNKAILIAHTDLGMGKPNKLRDHNYCGFINGEFVCWAFNFMDFVVGAKSKNEMPMNYQKSDIFSF